jgi:hydroxypyruvate reductase
VRATPALLTDIFREAVRACDAGALVRRVLALEAGGLRAGEAHVPLAPGARVLVAGAGKAAAAMAAAVEEALEGRVAGGLVVTKEGHAAPTRTVRVLEAAHPVPDERGGRATEALLALLAPLAPEDLVVFVVSGGASALTPLPAPGLTLADVQETTRGLLAAGATIAEINTVRKHLSAIHGGQLALRTAARLLVLVLSDVLGDDLAVIGSGPCVADPSSYADALAACARRAAPLPAAVRAHLRAGAAGQRPETPKPGDPRLARVAHVLVGSFATLRDAAERAARRRGLAVEPLAPPQEGDVGDVAAAYAARARHARPGRLLVGGGEPTVTLPPGAGRGGRSQQLALLMARALRGSGAAFLAAGSDGTDGATDAAGAVVDGATWDRAAAAGLTPAAALARCDAGPLHEALGTLVRTGPTGTNVLDLHLLATGGDRDLC